MESYSELKKVPHGEELMKVAFKGNLDLRYIDGEKWKIINQMSDRSFRALVNGQILEPPSGFITDFASVPTIFKILFPPMGKGRRKRYGKSAVIHDYLYKKGHIKKQIADKIFFAAMINSGVSLHICYLMYWAVVLFGIFAWRKHRRND